MVKTIFLVVIILFVLFIILNAIISSVDKKGDGELYKEDGPVVEKSYVPTHTRLVGNVIHRFPDEWSIDVKLSSDTVNVRVLEKFYNNTNVDDLVTVEFKKGKLSNQIYPLNAKKK